MPDDVPLEGGLVEDPPHVMGAWWMIWISSFCGP
jgi:hypothetical protein